MINIDAGLIPLETEPVQVAGELFAIRRNTTFEDLAEYARLVAQPESPENERALYALLVSESGAARLYDAVNSLPVTHANYVVRRLFEVAGYLVGGDV